MDLQERELLFVFGLVIEAIARVVRTGDEATAGVMRTDDFASYRRQNSRNFLGQCWQKLFCCHLLVFAMFCYFA